MAGFEALLLAQVSTLMPNGPVWQTYTPVWTASVTNPVIGNGTIAGRFYKTAHLVCFSIFVFGGSTTTGGTGNYFLSLPVTPLATGNFAVGSFNGLFDHSGVASGSMCGSIMAGSTLLGGTGNAGVGYIPCQTSTSGIVQWNATNPFTISGANFSVQIAGFYESNS